MNHLLNGASPGLTAPEQSTQNETRGQAGFFIGTQVAGTSNNSSSVVLALAEAQFQKVAAHAATLRCSIYPAEGGYVLTRQAWGLTKLCPDLRSVVQVLRLIEGDRK